MNRFTPPTRHSRRMIFVAFMAGLLIIYSSVAKADKVQEFALSWDLCAAATHAIERKARLPEKLLHAISIAEAGRRDDLNKVNVAWPWTVTSGSREWYFDSKEEAVAYVRAMLQTGERNIDVGCMQINLYYHGKNFLNLEQAFDPLRNVGYAASFLNKLRNNAPNWMTAVGNYHSTTPKFHIRYRQRVADIWKSELERRDSTARSYAVKSYYDTGYEIASLGVPPIDHLRTDELNAAFRNRQLQSINDGVGGAGGIGSQGNDNWKTIYMKAINTSESYVLQAQINRIRKAAEEQQRITDLMNDDENRKKAKRLNGLEQWRQMYSTSLEN